MIQRVSRGILVTSGLLFFALVLLQVNGNFHAENQQVFTYIASIKADSPLVYQIALYVTELGGTLFITLGTLLASVWLFSKKLKTAGIGFVVTVASCAILNSLFKISLAVSRPEAGQDLTSYSFPSGHSSAASVFFYCIAILFAYNLKGSEKCWVYLCFSVPVLVIAFSRVILGVHWPMDVLTGIVEGILFAAGYNLWLLNNISSLSIITDQRV